MNLLFLNSAHNWGGNEKWTYLAAKSLMENHSVYLAYRDDFLGSEFDFGIEKFKLPFLFEFDPFTLNGLISIVKEKQIDVLIPTKRKDYVLGGIVAKILRRKNIIRLGIVRELHDKWYNNIVYNKLADGIIVNAQQIKSTLMKSSFISGGKIRVIYNGLDIEALSQTIQKEASAKTDLFTICSVGRITRVKGFDKLLKGFSQFISVARPVDARLRIIGEGEELDALKELAADLRVDDKVSFTGFLSNPYSQLAASDLFVLLSKNEGISNALLEAMYFKNAVITTAVGGAVEIIEHGENGYLIDKIDIDRIGQLINELYSNPEKRRELGEAAHQTVLKKFSLKVMKENIERFCNEIV